MNDKPLKLIPMENQRMVMIKKPQKRKMAERGQNLARVLKMRIQKMLKMAK